MLLFSFECLQGVLHASRFGSQLFGTLHSFAILITHSALLQLVVILLLGIERSTLKFELFATLFYLFSQLLVLFLILLEDHIILFDFWSKTQPF